jgi:iron complex outermembrane recepter protein
MHSIVARRASGALALVLGAVMLGRPASLHAAPGATPPVQGVVRDSGGAPLANVQVIVSPINRTATTNGDGEFTFRALPAGTYHITTLLIGYAPGHVDVTVPASGAEPLQVAVTLRTTRIELSAVQVTASPGGADPRNVAQSTSEISGQALSRALGASLAQTLSGEPGLSVRYNGPAATAPVIRGLTGERILVLQDGDRTADLSSAAPDHGVSIDPLAAQRIEVVRGPASLLYGNQALGGVVNVISNDIPTSIPSHIDGYVAGQAESVNPGGALSGGVTVPVGKSFALVARGGGRHVDDLRMGDNLKLDNSYYRNGYGVGGFGFASDAATGGLVYRGYNFNYGLPSADAEGAHIEGHRHEVAGRSDFTLGSTLLNSFRLSGTAQWYKHDEIESTGAVGTSFDLKTQTLDLLGRTQLAGLTGAIGASGILKQYASTGEEALTPAANSNGAGIFVYQELPLVKVADADAPVPRVQIGARYDMYRIDSKAGDPKFGPARSLDFSNASGSLGLTIPLARQISAAVSVARAFRAPSVEELFSNAFHAAVGTFDKGNPDLKAEVNQGVDGILRMQGAGVNGQVSGFYSRINNYVTPAIVKDTTIDSDAGPVTVPLNQFSQADATLKGVEGRVEAEVVPHLVLGAMGDMVRGELKDGTPLAYLPAARIGGLARWDNNRLNAGAEVRHAFKQDRVPPAVASDDPAATVTGAYTLVNLSAGFNLTTGERVNSITLRADNLLDEKYADASSRIKNFAFNPGRNFSVVYKVLF